MSNSKPASRSLELDVLRAIAILLVLGMHSPAEHGESGWLRPLDLFMHQFGWTGVDLFYVLSGFLIGGLLFTEIKRSGMLDVRRFLLRRLLRIWPPYYFLLLFVTFRLTFAPGGSLAQAWSEMWPAYAHIQNFIDTPRDQLWSLAIEEHFYLALPIFLWFATKNTKPNGDLPAVPWTCAILCVGSLALRVVLAFTTHLNIRQQTYVSMDGLFFGVTLAYVKIYRPALLAKFAGHRKLLLGLSLLFFAPAALSPFSKVRPTIGYSGLYVGYALILIAFTQNLPKNSPLDRWKKSHWAFLLAAIGRHSYSIYLWHRDTSWWAYEQALALGRALHLPTELTWLLHTFAYFAASIVFGSIIGLLVEVPALKLRDRVFPPRVPTLANSGVVPQPTVE